jgi:hypothetical protein
MSSGNCRPFCAWTDRLAEIARLFGHCAGGRTSARSMARLGMHVSHTTIVRRHKQQAESKRNRSAIRVAGADA